MIRTSEQLISMDKIKVMAILNVNPDSFYKQSRFNNVDKALLRVEEIIRQGADFVDLGAYSSQPGAPFVSETEEWERLSPIIKGVKKTFPEIILSVDTFRASIAKQSIEEGASIINDISAGELDQEMFNIIKHYKVPYCMMHMRGTPQTMQSLCTYENLIQEIINYFLPKVKELNTAGVPDVWIDPGFGFAKTLEQNFELLANLQQLKVFDLPILVGLSRKSMIYKTLGITADESLNGTTALNMEALANGAKILRVHDVPEAIQTITLYEKLETYR